MYYFKINDCDRKCSEIKCVFIKLFWCYKFVLNRGSGKSMVELIKLREEWEKGREGV